MEYANSQNLIIKPPFYNNLGGNTAVYESHKVTGGKRRKTGKRQRKSSRRKSRRSTRKCQLKR
jgi:hypothetical protein